MQYSEIIKKPMFFKILYGILGACSYTNRNRGFFKIYFKTILSGKRDKTAALKEQRTKTRSQLIEKHIFKIAVRWRYEFFDFVFK